MRRRSRALLAQFGRRFIFERTCSPARPSQVKIGGTTGLILSAPQSDAEDGPWDMVVQYAPPADDPRRAKAWTKTLQTAPGKKNLQVEADAPGTYTLLDVKGRYCEGDVLAPETCPVTEIPKPSAEIDWRGIHEWYVCRLLR